MSQGFSGTPGANSVTSVTGTSNRISSTGGTTPVIDIDAAYVGQASLTTLGTVTTGVWTGTDVAAADGGTGRSSHTAYAVLCGGTTTTAAQQSIASVGTSGQILTSNGAAALPTFQTAAAGGGMVFLASATASTSASLVFTSSIDATYNSYLFIFDDVLPATGNTIVQVRTSTDGGSTYDSGASDYSYNGWYQAGAAAASLLSSAADTSIDILKTNGAAAGEGISGMLQLINPAATSETMLLYKLRAKNVSATPHMAMGSGARMSAADVDAIEFTISSGNITSGTISMYGMTTPS